MKKTIIFWAVLAATVIIAVIESLTIGFPELNLTVLSICGLCLGIGLIYMKLALYKVKDLVWCLLGGLVLTTFVTIGGHLMYCLPVVIDAFNLTGLESMLLAMATAVYVPAVYGFALYSFVFYFCDLKSKIQDFK